MINNKTTRSCVCFLLKLALCDHRPVIFEVQLSNCQGAAPGNTGDQRRKKSGQHFGDAGGKWFCGVENQSKEKNMKKIVFDKHCPLCGTILKKRIRRKFWMRLIPGTKNYSCNYCGAHSLCFFETVACRCTLPAILWSIREF